MRDDATRIVWDLKKQNLWAIRTEPSRKIVPHPEQLWGLGYGMLKKRILQQNSLARHWARDWRALALTQVHHGSRLSDSCEERKKTYKAKEWEDGTPPAQSRAQCCARAGVGRF